VYILASVVSWAFRAYEFLIFVQVLLSWFSATPGYSLGSHPLIQLLQRLTEPVLAPLRRVIPPVGGVLDISPVIALILLDIIRQVLVRLLLGL